MSERPFIDFDGRDENGSPFFHVYIKVPDPVPFDTQPTEYQRTAIIQFYSDQYDVTASQAHAMLCFRDYGKLLAERIAGWRPTGLQNLLSHFVAAIISHNHAVAKDVIAWSDKRHRNGSEPVIARTKHFQWIVDRLSENIWHLQHQGVVFPINFVP